MSQEKIAIVRTLYERWNAGDRGGIAEYCDPAIE
jgi:hypothetical protein